MNFVSYKQLAKDVAEFAAKVPDDVYAIVGVVRSGMIPAAMLAFHMNKRLGSIDREGNIQIFSGGDRDSKTRTGKILILDDSCDTGNTLATVKMFNHGDHDRYYACLYSSENPHHLQGKTGELDFYLKILKSPRMFEWNFMSSKQLVDSCVDIDGVLTVSETDDHPLYKPSRSLGVIVTGRMEERRAETEEWLRDNDIHYGSVIMRQDPKMPVEELKADIYKDSAYTLFIESSEFQAKKIQEATNKPVLCIETMQVYE